MEEIENYRGASITKDHLTEGLFAWIHPNYVDHATDIGLFGANGSVDSIEECKTQIDAMYEDIFLEEETIKR